LSAQSLFYCQRIGLALEQLNLGVLIQPLTNVIASGMGTVYPHSFEIQANWGLAQSWQQGEVSPDHFILDRKTGIIVSQELGNKHRGYRLKYSPDLENLAENCLQKYIFSLEEQEQYCLSELTLAELFNLFNNLTQDNFSWNSLEWVLRESKQSQFPPLAITNLTPSLDVCPIFSPSVLKTKTINHSSDQTPLKGIGAAPGRIHAFIEVIAEETFRDLSLGKNKVIVTADISPSQLSLLKNAAGVITEFGGMISHAAILAR
ncbi:MAG TPA: pyruvate, water dikinase, partial [Cyanothece sp. UBA12306]|nr:pyruvate, water dikinase [Cyanothece sp. UBA12306]